MNEISMQKRIRLIELALILSVSFLPFFLSSLFIYLCLYSIDTSINVRFFIDAITKITYVALLIYILFRQGKSIKDIGFSFSWKDIIRAILIFTTVIIILNIYLLLIGKPLNQYGEHTNVFVGKISIIYFLAMLINPFFEEIILRAYLMCEIEFFLNSKIIAIVVSVLIQTSGHLYEGFYSMGGLALTFIIFSVYFAKYKKIMPIIMAHAIMDIGVMLSSGNF